MNFLSFSKNVGLAALSFIGVSLAVLAPRTVLACDGFWGSLDPTCRGRIFGPPKRQRPCPAAIDRRYYTFWIRNNLYSENFLLNQR